MMDPSRPPLICTLLLPLLLVSMSSAVAGAADWLQFGGPTRDFKVDVTGLAASCRKRVRARCGAASWGRATRRSPSRGIGCIRCIALVIGSSSSASTPRRARRCGSTPYDAPRLTDIPGKPADYNLDAEPGPHAMPLMSATSCSRSALQANSHCLDKNTGKLVWGRDLHVEFLAPVKKRGYAISPFPYKNTIIVPAGAEGASIVALTRRMARLCGRSTTTNSPTPSQP